MTCQEDSTCLDVVSETEGENDMIKIIQFELEFFQKLVAQTHNF